MRMGVIGGTFDPPHVGHLIIAQEAYHRLGLSQVAFVPAGSPPHKGGQPISPAGQRVEMVELAIAADERFTLSRVDVEREGPSFTVDTIALLLERWGPEAEIYFLIGADLVDDLPTWHQPQRLLRSSHVVAFRRPGHAIDLQRLERLLPGASTAIRLIDAPLVAISATEIRARVRSGAPIRYLVPAAVERFIVEHCLYRDRPG